MIQWFQRTILDWLFTPKNGSIDLPTSVFLSKAKEAFDKKWSENKPGSGSLAEFQLVKTIGKGKYGRVMLARCMKRKTVYALKILRKTEIVRLQQVRHVMLEKRVLQSIDHPFLVPYIKHFKNNGHLFFVMEFVAGGDLFTLLKRLVRLNDYECRFWISQVILAFEYLHYVGIIFRDLKPENLLIDPYGYLKLTDFGFAKRIDNDKTSSICGTPEYFAPELIRHEPYSYSVDWWTLGILMYELLRGFTPFKAADYFKMSQKIVQGKIDYPSYFKSDTIDIVNNLLKTEVDQRLTSAREIKNHNYFKKVDWQALLNREVNSPYVPQINKESDVSNFDVDIPEEEIQHYDHELYPQEFKDF